MQPTDFVAIGSLVSLIGYVLWFISRADSRLFQLADRQAVELANQEKEIRELKESVGHMNDKLSVYVAGTRILIQQIRALGENPQWEPPNGL